ncbi:MAG: acetylxylan esterase [Pirellulaceae bacterium]
MIERGEESDPANARSTLQARCVHLARMGMVVFHYDMVGYADCTQIPMSVAHGFTKRRPEDNAKDSCLFFSPQAEARTQSIMGLQTWNSIRAVDFLEQLDGVDANRIGVTGCSGGGTQTFVLAALDPRIKAAFPAAMVGTHMQGGCTCENCSLLRVGTGNVEIAALFAPKPMGLSSANDWTKEMEHDGFPELQRLYDLYGESDNTFLAPSTHLPHGYNEIARRTMYAWFAKHLVGGDGADSIDVQDVYEGNMDDDSPFQEKSFTFLTPEQLSVWNDEHPRPESGIAAESNVLQQWNLARPSLESSKEKRDLLHALLAPESKDFELKFDELEGDRPTFNIQMTDRLSDRVWRFRITMPEADIERSNTMNIVWIADNFDGGRSNDIESIISATEDPSAVLLEIDGQQAVKENSLVENGREAAGYTFGYNSTELALHSRAISYLISDTATPLKLDRINLYSEFNSAPSMIVGAIDSEVPIDTIVLPNKISFDDIDSIRHAYFLPGIALLGGFEGVMELANPKSVRYLTDE